MGSFKNEILHALKKSNSTNEILDKISNYQIGSDGGSKVDNLPESKDRQFY